MFAPPNQAYRIRSRFHATRQGKKELLDYVQDSRTLITGTAADPLPDTLTVFMKGLRTSAARTEVFRVHPSSFEETVSVALNAEHNFRSARPDWYAGSTGSSSGPEPMDLSYAEDEEAELLAAEQRTSIRRCITCGSTRHLRVSCRVRNQRKALPSQASGSSRGNGAPRGRGQQDPAPKRAGLSYEKSVCKPGLLVVQANVKGFEKPWRVLIDSGASGNYARRTTLEGSQQYTEALKVQTRDTISVRLVTGTLVTVSKVSVDLGVKFLDFDSVERCLVLYLDSRYDLILGMAWLERHEPWIDWKSKTLGATHFASSGALVSHEPRGHEAESAMVLDIGMSELVSNEVAVVPERGSQDVRGAARYPRSGVSKVNDSPLCGPRGTVDRRSRHHGRSPGDAGGVAPIPLSEGHGSHGSELRFSRDTDSSLRTDGAVAPGRGDGDVTTPTSSGRSRSRRERRMRRRVSVTSRMSDEVSNVTSSEAPRDCSEQLYTLANGVTGGVDGDISLDSLPAVNALLELDEMSIAEFGEALKAGDLAEVVEYTDVVSKNPPMGLPPDRGVRHEIDLVPGTKYCVTRQWPLPKEQCDVIDVFFRAKHEAGLVRESKSPHFTPTSCVRKPNDKWRIVHAFNKLNAATIPAQTPIPRKDVLQNNMVGCTLCSALDLVDGYYQLLMRACDVPLTAVSTPSGILWEWLVMPPGAVERTSNVQSSCDAVVQAPSGVRTDVL
ncbi:hypothetical protein PC114_g9596 [Phytophthora cactorum]|nr:hypothetical protein PC112_g8675 [Phytophthora cactorum]KAG2910779.1 hypothetical protein PC114_g9596 [Phytophthora cactorum]